PRYLTYRSYRRRSCLKVGFIRSTVVVALAAAAIGVLAPASTGTTALPPCKDGAYRLTASRWSHTLRWQFDASSTPRNLVKGATERILEHAATNVVTGRNSCGLPDRIAATQRYLGRTTRRPNITRSGACGTSDGHNVVGFGHVAEGLHGHLTMAPYILPCQDSQATLGLGDVRGLRAKY